MAKCKHETKNGRCGLKESYAYRKECYTEECCRCHEPIEPCGRNEPQTNADHIRAMSDEELAEFLAEVEYRRSGLGGGAVWGNEQSAFKWLKKPVEE